MSYEYAQYIPVPVKKTRIGAVEVSTILTFSGIANRQMAETLIFIDHGVTVEGLQDQDGERGEPGAAKSLHEAWVKKVRAAYANDTETENAS